MLPSPHDHHYPHPILSITHIPIWICGGRCAKCSTKVTLVGYESGAKGYLTVGKTYALSETVPGCDFLMRVCFYPSRVQSHIPAPVPPV